MDERKITDIIAGVFATCANDIEVQEIEKYLNDIVTQEKENRLYELRKI